MKGTLKEFRQNCAWFGLFFLLSTFDAYADTAVGKVIFVKGQLKAARGNTSLSLTRGSDIMQGDTLITGAHSESQIRFTDGGQLTLLPNSEFKLQAYQNDSGQKRFSGEFLKGSFRAVSGIIGKTDPQNYEIQTSVATIGIRGTDYSATLDSHGELFTGVWSGKIMLSNCAGDIVIGEGEPYQYARVSSPEELPRVLADKPQILINPDSVTPSSTASSGSNSTDSKEICIQ